MAKINLWDYYPLHHDIFLDIPDEVATILLEAERQEEAYRRRMYRYKAQYSLDRNDGIEHSFHFLRYVLGHNIGLFLDIFYRLFSVIVGWRKQLWFKFLFFVLVIIQIAFCDTFACNCNSICDC